MSDILLTFVEKEQNKLIQLFLQEKKEKGEGALRIVLDRNKYLVSYLPISKISYEDVKKQMSEYKNDMKSKSITVKDKWIVTLPILQLDITDEITIPIWNLILDDGRKYYYFKGYPQSVKIDAKTNGLQYVLVGDPEKKIKCINNWTVEGTTVGQKYIDKCVKSSKLYHYYMTFRSDSDYCKVVQPGTPEDGKKIIDRIKNTPFFTSNIERFRNHDKIGCPKKYKYGKFGYFSPGTLKYVNTTYELLQTFGNMKNWNILEFGAGYGGLSMIMSNVVKWGSYTLTEIGGVILLMNTCIKYTYLQNFKTIISKDIKTDEKYDLFISEFGFCELDEKGIDNYLYVLQNSRNAYLAMNLWNKNSKKKLKDKLSQIYNSIEESPVFVGSKWGDYIWVCRENKLL